MGFALKLLLDTHIWLWLRFDKDRVPSPVRRRISSASTTLHLSAVCVLELAIKQAVGKLRLDVPLTKFVDDLTSNGVLTTTVGIEHAVAVGALPFHHRDPFDRTLIAQAKVEGLTLVTADPRILRYDIPTIDARK